MSLQSLQIHLYGVASNLPLLIINLYTCCHENQFNRLWQLHKNLHLTSYLFWFKLIRKGDIDSAFCRLRDWYPQVVQVDSLNIKFMQLFCFQLLNHPAAVELWIWTLQYVHLKKIYNNITSLPNFWVQLVNPFLSIQLSKVISPRLY